MTINDIKINSEVYYIDNISGSYDIVTSRSSKLNFGVFCVPRSYESLEFLICPSESLSYAIETYIQNYQDFVLCILNDDLIKISISKQSIGRNTIYYSTKGDISQPILNITSIPQTNIIVLRYNGRYRGDTATRYSIQSTYNTRTYKCYDKSGKSLNFNVPLSIPSLPVKQDPYIAYGRHIQTVYYPDVVRKFIRPNTIIVFTESKDFHGVATTSGTSLDILGTTRINGNLTFRSYKSSARYSFIAFNYSMINCSYPVVIVGDKNYQIPLETYDEYCVILQLHFQLKLNLKVMFVMI